MCVLAGCDFVDSLPGIGIKKAHQNLRRTRCFLKVGATWVLLLHNLLLAASGFFYDPLLLLLSMVDGQPMKLPFTAHDRIFDHTQQLLRSSALRSTAAPGTPGGACPAL